MSPSPVTLPWGCSYTKKGSGEGSTERGVCCCSAPLSGCEREKGLSYHRMKIGGSAGSPSSKRSPGCSGTKRCHQGHHPASLLAPDSPFIEVPQEHEVIVNTVTLLTRASFPRPLQMLAQTQDRLKGKEQRFLDCDIVRRPPVQRLLSRKPKTKALVKVRRIKDKG